MEKDHFMSWLHRKRKYGPLPGGDETISVLITVERRKDIPSAALRSIKEKDYFSSSRRPGSLAKTSLTFSLVTTVGGSS